MLNQGGLSDKQLKAACALPLRDKAAIFGRAEVWFEEQRGTFECIEPKGAYVLINATTLEVAVGKHHDDAAKNYAARFGPTPPGGREFLGMQL